MKIEGMTDEEKRIKIAEACGWKRSDELDYTLYGTTKRGEHLQFPGREPAYEKDGILARASGLPDYLNDLNAMHAVEETLIYVGDDIDTDLISAYHSNLVICADAGRSQSATARQRADAFLISLP